jgi:hypothetical protein
MAAFVATKARMLVTVATAGAMFAGVAGLQAQAQEATVLANAAETAPTVTPPTIAAPTATATTVKKKKKKKPKKTAVVVQAPVAQKKATPKSHGSSSGSK